MGLKIENYFYKQACLIKTNTYILAYMQVHRILVRSCVLKSENKFWREKNLQVNPCFWYVLHTIRKLSKKNVAFLKDLFFLIISIIINFQLYASLQYIIAVNVDDAYETNTIWRLWNKDFKKIGQSKDSHLKIGHRYSILATKMELNNT